MHTNPNNLGFRYDMKKIGMKLKKNAFEYNGVKKLMLGLQKSEQSRLKNAI